MTPDGNTWLYKNKEHGMLAAAASLGMIMMWNIEEGLTIIDKFLYSNEEYVRAGACLAIALFRLNSQGVGPTYCVLPEQLNLLLPSFSAAIVGLGVAYAALVERMCLIL